MLVVAMLFLKSAPSTDYRMPGSAVFTFAVATVSICASGPLVSGAKPPYMLNPTGLLPSWDYLVICIFVIVLGGEVLNWLLAALNSHVMNIPRMDTSGAKGKLEKFAPVDFCVIACNSFSHFMLVSHLWAIILEPEFDRRLGSLTIMNGPVAFVVFIIFNDFLYWCGHGGMHMRLIYPYVHKQHHRQCIPFRGLADALNIHPFEEFVGGSIFAASLKVMVATTGMHAGTAWALFVVWSLFNILNHFDFDSWLHVPVPFPSSTRDHQMHHRVPNCNYEKLTMIWDRAFGTYLGFHEVNGNKARAPLAGERFPLSEALPSPACVMPLMPFIACCALLVEAARTSATPVAADVMQMAPSFVLMTFATVACAAHKRRYGASLKAE